MSPSPIPPNRLASGISAIYNGIPSSAPRPHIANALSSTPMRQVLDRAPRRGSETSLSLRPRGAALQKQLAVAGTTETECGTAVAGVGKPSYWQGIWDAKRASDATPSRTLRDARAAAAFSATHPSLASVTDARATSVPADTPSVEAQWRVLGLEDAVPEQPQKGRYHIDALLHDLDRAFHAVRENPPLASFNIHRVLKPLPASIVLESMATGLAHTGSLVV